MRDINRCHHIDHVTNEMWISDKEWDDRFDGVIHYLPGLRQNTEISAKLAKELADIDLIRAS